MGNAEDNPCGPAEMTQAEYNELAQMADTAEDCLNSIKFGSHAFLILLLRTKYGVMTDRLGAIKEARKLCNQYLDSLKYEVMAEEQ